MPIIWQIGQFERIILNLQKRSMMPAGHHPDSKSTRFALEKSVKTCLGVFLQGLAVGYRRIEPRRVFLQG